MTLRVPARRSAAAGFSPHATMPSTSSNGVFPTRSATSKSNMAATDGKLRVAAIGDLHVMEDSVAPYRELFIEVSNAADVLVLCGDLTNFGKTREAEILAEDIKSCAIPVVGVLGNHDYECGQPEKVCAILHEAGMTVLDEQAIEIEGIGFAGVKGFLGGVGGGGLAPLGEAVAKAVGDEAVHAGPPPEPSSGAVLGEKGAGDGEGSLRPLRRSDRRDAAILSARRPAEDRTLSRRPDLADAQGDRFPAGRVARMRVGRTGPAQLS